MESIKYFFAAYVIGLVALNQWCAWMFGVNGQVFAFTSLIIGAIAGSILGFSVNLRNSPKEK